MYDYDLVQKLDQLSAENLATVLFALLLGEESVDHFNDAFAQNGGQLVDSFGDDAAIRDGIESGFGGNQPSQSADVRFSRAA